jgi:hypothetical protein
VSGTAILFVGGINQDVFLDLAYPPGKFATEPSAVLGRIAAIMKPSVPIANVPSARQARGPYLTADFASIGALMAAIPAPKKLVPGP